MNRPFLLGAALMALLAGPALSQQAAAPAPAADATTSATATAPAGVALSSILTRIEGDEGFLHFDRIEWDARRSQWNIAYQGTQGRKVSVTVDGKTGEPVIG